MALRLSFADQGLAPVPSQRPSGAGLDLAPLPQGALGGGAAVLAAGGAAFADMADALAKTQRETALLKAKTELSRRIGAAELDANGDAGAFRKAAGAAMVELGAGLPDDTARRQFAADADGVMATREFNVRRDGLRRQAGEAAAAIEERLGGLTGEAAAARNPAERAHALLQGREAVLGGMRSGFLSPDRGATRLRKFLNDADEATARRLLAENPGEAAAALRDPGSLPNLPAVRRYQLLDSALRRQRVGGIATAADPADLPEPPPPPPESPEQHAALEAEAARVGWQDDGQALARTVRMEADGRVAAMNATRERENAVIAAFAGEDAMPADLEDWRDLLSPSLLAAADGATRYAGLSADDPEMARGLLLAVADADPAVFRERAAAAVADGRLRPESMARLVRSNATATAETPAARGLREARAAVAEATDIGPMEEWLGAADVPALREVQTEALREMDEWAANNANALPSAARAVAEEIGGRLRERIQDRAMATLPRPALLSGSPGPYAPDVLDEAEMSVLDDRDAGRMGDGEAAAQLRLIEAWRVATPSMESTDEAPRERENKARTKAMGRALGLGR